MGDHVAAVVPVMLVWLNGPVGIFSTRKQGILAGLFWRQPVKFPTPPRMPSPRIEKMRSGPGLAAVSAHSDLRHLSLACPCSAEDDIAPIRQNGFVYTRPGDGGLQLHFCQRAPHRLAIEKIPIGPEVGTNTSLLDLSARPIRGAASVARLAPAAGSRFLLPAVAIFAGY